MILGPILLFCSSIGLYQYYIGLRNVLSFSWTVMQTQKQTQNIGLDLDLNDVDDASLITIPKQIIDFEDEAEAEAEDDISQIGYRYGKGKDRSGSRTKPFRKKSRSRRPKFIADRFESKCTHFQQIIIDGPSDKVHENESCISISKIPTCHSFCRKQKNLKPKYRFACRSKNDSGIDLIRTQVAAGRFVDLARRYANSNSNSSARKLGHKWPSGCVKSEPLVPD